MSLTSSERSALEALGALLRARADLEGGPSFMGWPDRWWEDHSWRCINDHVSIRVLMSEARGGDVCLACYAPLHLTFPEDRDGPLG